jgi:hypothetical protein
VPPGARLSTASCHRGGGAAARAAAAGPRSRA